jgi:predicted  nucleic acid-binding Zn-ribbon protein
MSTLIEELKKEREKNAELQQDKLKRTKKDMKKEEEELEEEINKLKQKRKEESKALTMNYEQFKLFLNIQNVI